MRIVENKQCNMNDRTLRYGCGILYGHYLFDIKMKLSDRSLVE